MNPVVIVEAIDDLLKVTDKLLAKTPNYPEKNKADLAELKKNFSVYKDTPLEFRVNSYLHNLHKEILGHVNSMVDAI